MTEPSDFLSRWSRRKREAKAEADVDSDIAQSQRTGELPIDADGTQGKQPDNHQLQGDRHDEAKPEAIFDLSKLPSLESIGPATDIRVFLQPGVPEALSRAALRRAWSADPGIRDFIGLAENSWDFTSNDGMHGFGALDPADAKRLLAQFFADNEPKVEAAGEDTAQDGPVEDAMGEREVLQDEASDSNSADNAPVDAIASETVPGDNGPVGGDELPQSESSVSVASQQKQDVITEVPLLPRHGRALPQ